MPITRETPTKMAISDEMLGRSFNGSGVPIDKGPPVLAEDLAKKSALLAGKDNTLKKNSWLLIAHAKKMQGDTTGATEAESKAAGF
jgi:hypothetical protein